MLFHEIYGSYYQTVCAILREAGNGELTKKLNVSLNAFSAQAKAKIEELGGKAEVI